MAALRFSLVLALFLAHSNAEEPICVYGERESRCALSSAPQRLLLHENKLFVGAIDYVYSFSLDLTSPASGDVRPSAYRTERCEDYEAHQPALCRNFVRVLQPVNESTLLVCGTNAFFPKCRFLQVGNLSDWELMTEEGQKDLGFSPHSNNTNVAVMANNGRFFTATFFSFRNIQQTIGMSPLLLEGDGTFTIQTPSSSPQWIDNPVFVSAYDVGDHVYLFAREPALELGRSVEYSRAIRVCKNDPGFRRFPDEDPTFRTFQKARLRCRTAGADGSNPYDYDGLQATYLLRPRDGGEPTLYGTFSSPKNGPEGSALCKFRLSTLETVFEDGQYLVQEDSEWHVESGGAFNCSSASERTEEEAKRHLLVHSVASASEPQPLTTVLGDSLLHVAVDVVEYSGREMEVVVLGQRRGLLTQVVHYQGTIYKNTIKSVDEEITNVLLSMDPLSEERQVVFTTESSVQALTLGRCTLYNTCFKCFDSHDPYCAWDHTARRCANKLTTPSLVDVITSSEETVVDFCGPREATPPPDQPGNPSSCPHTPDTPDPPPSTEEPTTTGSDSPTTSETTDDPHTGNTAGLDRSGEARGENTGLVAGATAGGFLLGVPVGLIVCYMFFAIFLKKNGKSCEQAVPGDTSGGLRVSHNQLQGHSEKQPALSNNSHEPRQITHRNHTSHKNVNQQSNHSKEDDDMVTELLPLGSSSREKGGLPHTHKPRQHPPLTVRSPQSTATRCQRASDWESNLSPLSSPV